MKKQKKLKNGLTVMYLSAPKECARCSACLSINVGHVNEPQLGLASLFEHTLLLQCPGVIPVFGGTMTAYTAGGADVAEVLEKLSKVLTATEVNEELVERARHLIVEETQRVSFQTVRRMKLLYKHTAFGADLVRPTEEFLRVLNSYTTEDVRQFANRYYTAKNAVLVVSCPVNQTWAEVFEYAEKYFDSVPAGTKQQELRGDIYTGGFGRLDVWDDVTKLMFGWDLSPFSVESSPTMNVMMSLFLYRLERMYGEEAPDVQVELKIAGYYGARTLRVFVSSPSASARRLTDIFCRCVNEMYRSDIEPELFERVRTAAMIEKLDKYEKSDNAALEVAWQLIGRGHMYDVSNRISSIGMTEPIDVAEMAESVFRASRVTYIVATAPEKEIYSYRELMQALKSDFLLKETD